MIHLKHKEHGIHIAYSDAEAKTCEKSGWKRIDFAKEHEAARKEKMEPEKKPRGRPPAKTGDVDESSNTD